MSPTTSVPAKIRLLICGLSDAGLEFINAMFKRIKCVIVRLLGRFPQSG
jgi:hypothetical protein